MSEFFKIVEHPSIENARKDIDINGDPYVGDIPSEWAMAVTLGEFKIGEEIDEEIFYQQLNKNICQQTIDDLCTKGLMESFWDENELKYRLTPEGNEYAKKIGLG